MHDKKRLEAPISLNFLLIVIGIPFNERIFWSNERILGFNERISWSNERIHAFNERIPVFNHKYRTSCLSLNNFKNSLRYAAFLIGVSNYIAKRLNIMISIPHGNRSSGLFKHRNIIIIITNCHCFR